MLNWFGKTSIFIKSLVVYTDFPEFLNHSEAAFLVEPCPRGTKWCPPLESMLHTLNVIDLSSTNVLCVSFDTSFMYKSSPREDSYIKPHTPMIPQWSVSMGQPASDLRVNVMLPVYMAGQDIYLFWLVRSVCELILAYARTYTWTILPRPSSPPPCGCKETSILWKAQFKFILYLLELLLHFTAHLSLWLEESLFSPWRRQGWSIKVLFLEPSFLTVEIRGCLSNMHDLSNTARTTWCY